MSDLTKNELYLMQAFLNQLKKADTISLQIQHKLLDGSIVTQSIEEKALQQFIEAFSKATNLK